MNNKTNLKHTLTPLERKAVLFAIRNFITAGDKDDCGGIRRYNALCSAEIKIENAPATSQLPILKHLNGELLAALKYITESALITESSAHWRDYYKSKGEPNPLEAARAAIARAETQL